MQKIKNNMKIPIEVSARHVHLSKKDFEKLFGKNKSLSFLRKLSQPDEFGCKEVVEIIGSKNKIENVRVIGPFRKSSQLEISLTDAYNLKLKSLPRIRLSGNLLNVSKVLVKGPRGSVRIPCIIAKRHLHCSVKEAEQLRIKNKQKVFVKILGIRKVIFGEIVVRVSENYKLYLHLDTDEGNAGGIFKKTFGELIK
jgi:putative phosphotransacetylase